MLIENVSPSSALHQGTIAPQTVACGCCKRTLDADSIGTGCNDCGEYLCRDSHACIALCKCDRTIRGVVTQLWFRWSNDIYAFWLQRDRRKGTA